MVDAAAARRFIAANARLLERRVAAVIFDDAPPDGAVDALMAYRNADGGFGHGLEPDKLVPDSQPLDVEVAFERLHAVGADRPDIVGAACDWLLSVTADSGAVPIVLPSIDGHPRAAHWTPLEYPPHLNPTAAIAGYAHALGVEHRWVERATDYAYRELENAIPDEAHTLLAASRLVEYGPERDRAAAIGERIAGALPDAAFMSYEPSADGYGVTPLDFAPQPRSSARVWFSDSIIDGHLERLAASQESDGGWPLAWEPPSQASHLAWRGIRTIHALSTLNAYNHCLLPRFTT